MSEQISSDLDFEQKIKLFSPGEQFLAREVRKVQMECARRESCYVPATDAPSMAIPASQVITWPPSRAGIKVSIIIVGSVAGVSALTDLGIKLAEKFFHMG